MNTTYPASTVDRPRWLFWACFIALIATSFGFIIRAFVVDAWAVQFDLSETQKGEILGVGLWPFAISIILFSLVIDRIGYGKAMIFAFACHVASVIITINARSYWWLYVGTFINSLGNGTIEAVINPVVASMFPRAKTKWLNILHAGWPGGLALGGLLTLSLSPDGVLGRLFGGDSLTEIAVADIWKLQVGLVLIPTVIYGLMMLRARFPVSERVAAGVSYRAMLQEAGVLGMFIAVFLVVWELTRVASSVAALFNDQGRSLFDQWQWGAGHILITVFIITVIVMLPYAVYVRFAPGRWLFILLMLLMIPLATTELGTDAWIDQLMEGIMQAEFELQGLWVLIYSASIMMILRFCCGPIVKKLTPLGVLAMTSAFAAVGIAAMSQAHGAAIIIAAATIYAIGQTFFWPTTLGVVAERFPRGGALTLNAIAGVGMLGVGIIGTQFTGFVLDKQIHAELQAQNPALHQSIIGEPQVGIFGPYQPLDSDKVEALPKQPKQEVEDSKSKAKRNALLIVSSLPVGMFVCYLLLIGYFKSRGGYEAEILTDHPEEFIGGVNAPVK